MISPAKTKGAICLLVMLGSMIVSSVAVAAPTRDQLRQYVRDAWQLHGITNDALDVVLNKNFPDTSIGWSDVIGGLIASDKVIQAINESRPNDAAYEALKFGADYTIKSTLKAIGFQSVAATARLATLPIEYSLLQFEKEANQLALLNQQRLYFAARDLELTQADILAMYEPSNGNIVQYTDEGWLYIVEDVDGNFLQSAWGNHPGNLTVRQTYDICEQAYLLDAKAHQYASDKSAIGASLLQDLQGVALIRVTPAWASAPAAVTFDATAFGYDAVGNVSSMRYAKGQTYQWKYDPDHNLSKRIDALSRTTNYGYDATKSYLTTIDYPTGADVSVDYDDFGRVESVTDATGVVSYTYDDNDLVLTVTTDYAGSAPSKTITYAYNPDGSRRSMAVDGVSAAFNYWYAYNAGPTPSPGLAVTMSNPGLGTPVRCYYNIKGQIVRQTAPRLLTDYTYDNRGLRSSVDNWASFPTPDVAGSRFYNMQYDPAGNLLQASIYIPSVGSAVDRSGTVYYEYNDSKDRLTRERRTISGQPDLYDVYFDCDDADNITQVRDLYLPTYNENNQIDEAGYSYNANGNATSYHGFGFEYDYEDLPSQVTGGVTSPFSMAFRSDGLRAWRESTTWGRDCFLYDGDRVICEFNAEDGSTNWYYNYGPNGLAMRSSAPSTYYVYSFDHLGSLSQTFYSGTGSPGLAQRTVIYDAFGKLWWDQLATGSMFSMPDPPGFAGQWGAYSDHETRPSGVNTPLVLMGIRYYDPITARFMSRDPALGINDYAYCGNNPVGRVDADGEILETIADIGGIAWSTYDLIKNPSWANLGYLAWDVGATAVPFVPGSYVAKGAKIASRGVKAVAGARHATRAAKVGKALTKGYKVFKSSTFRHNLGVLTKGIPAGKQAHHVLPQALEKDLRRLFPKLNINDPKFGAWVDKGHQKWSRAYQNEWQRFLDTKPSWKEVQKFARKMGNQYGFKVNF